jgi:hypothetical protein
MGGMGCVWLTAPALSDAVSPFVRSDDGAKAQKKLWKELAEMLEAVQPGVMALV